VIERLKTTPEDDRLILDETADPQDQWDIATRVGFDQLYHLEPALAKMLFSDNDYRQMTGLATLVARWRMEKYLDRAIELLNDSPKAVVRSDAAGALRGFLWDIPDRDRRAGFVKRILREWARRIVDDPDWAVRRECYRYLVLELDPERHDEVHHLPNDFDPALHGDWSVIGPLLDPADVPHHEAPADPLSLPGDEALLGDEAAPVEARVAALQRLAADRRYELEEAVRNLVVHPDPALRGAAMLELCRTWRRWEKTEDCWDMLHHDPGWQARASAAGATAAFVVGAGVFRQSHLQHLARAVVEDDDPRVQRAAWVQVLAILGDNRPVPEDFDPSRDVDLALIEPYLAER
jgi:hypothetical protein